MAENTIIFMVIIQFVALTTCTLVGLACKAIHRLIGHSIEEIKLQFVGPQDWEEMEWAEVPVYPSSPDGLDQSLPTVPSPVNQLLGKYNDSNCGFYTSFHW